MKIKTILLILLLPLSLFAQKYELRHELDVYAGYARRTSVSGVTFRVQYAFGPAPIVDLLVSTSVSTGTRQRWDVQYPKYTVSSTSIGARFRADMGDRLSLKFGVMNGVDWDVLYEKINNHYSTRTLYLHGSLDARVQMDVMISPQTSIGLFYDYSFKYSYTKAVRNDQLPDIHFVGIAFGYKFKKQ